MFFWEKRFDQIVRIFSNFFIGSIIQIESVKNIIKFINCLLASIDKESEQLIRSPCRKHVRIVAYKSISSAHNVTISQQCRILYLRNNLDIQQRQQLNKPAIFRKELFIFRTPLIANKMSRNIQGIRISQQNLPKAQTTPCCLTEPKGLYILNELRP